jgi:hypothetical protein
VGAVRRGHAGPGGDLEVLRRPLGVFLPWVLPANLEGAVFGHSLKTYGWVDLVVAVILIACAFAVFAGKAFGRWVGIFAAAIAAISAIWWMPYYPVWAFTYIVIAALVIYALAAYGGEPEPA